MATCKQIRSETENMFLSLNDIRVQRGDVYFSAKQLERIMPLLKRVPRSLGLDSGRVVMPLQCYGKNAELETQWSSGCLKHFYLTTSQAIRPFQLFLDLNVGFHQWSGSGNGERIVCAQDTPVTMRDCGHLHLELQVGVYSTAALSRIDKVIDDKLESLRQHRLHRLCPVRVMLRQFESGLEGSRQYLRNLNDFVCESADGVVTYADA